MSDREITPDDISSLKSVLRDIQIACNLTQEEGKEIENFADSMGV